MFMKVYHKIKKTHLTPFYESLISNDDAELSTIDMVIDVLSTQLNYV